MYVCVSAHVSTQLDLAIAGEANAKLCIYHLMVEVQVGFRVCTLSPMRHVQISCRVLVLSHPQEDLPCNDSRVPTWCTGAVCVLCVCVCVCVRVCVCVCVSMCICV